MISIVHMTSYNGSAGGHPTTLTIPSTTAGNTLVVLEADYGQSGGNIGFQPFLGATGLTQSPADVNFLATGANIWYLENIAGSQTSLSYPVVSPGAVVVYELTPCTYDQSNNDQGGNVTSASELATSITATGNNAYFVVIGQGRPNSTPAGTYTSVSSPWTLDLSQSPLFSGFLGNTAAGMGGFAHILNSTGSQQATFTLANSQGPLYGSTAISFKDSSVGTGNIVIQKTTVPGGSSQSFAFTSSYGSPFTLTDGQSNNSGPLTPGTYSVTETPIVGWTTGTSSDPANIVVTSGNTTTVTFTNTQQNGTITVSKATVPSGAAQSFLFTPSYAQKFSLQDGQSKINSLAPGTYSVAETPVTGWVTTTSTDPTNLVVSAGTDTPITFTNTLNVECVPPPSPTFNFVYIKSFPLTSGQDYTVALDSSGTLWVEDVNHDPFVFRVLTHGILPGSYMLSTTQDDVEYMCFSNLQNGTDIPRQYNPQPAIGGFTLDRVSQVGPGAPPTFQPTSSVTTGQVTITSWAGAMGIVTFQAVNTFIAGSVVTLNNFAVSTFFNNRTVTVLGTGLSGTQFEVAFTGFSGGTDSGTATPQFGFGVQSITQPPAKAFNGQTALWSAGPGTTSPGGTITLYYGGVVPQDPAIVAAFNSGVPLYIYVTGAPFGNGTQLVNGIGTGTPPFQHQNIPFFTFAAPSIASQISGNPPNGGGNNGTYEITAATLITQQPIANLAAGDQITFVGVTPAQWDAEWSVTVANNSGVYLITQTSMANGVATYNWTWSGTGPAIAPTGGELVTVIQTLNGNGIFNVVDALIATVTGGPNSGTFTIGGLGTSTQNIPAVPETGQAETSGTSFTFDPGQTTFQTTVNPIFGNAVGNQGIVVVIGTNQAIAPGTRQAVVFFETRNGFKTACSAPITFTTANNASYLIASNIPIGPPDVIRRWIAFTTAGPNGIAGPNFYTIDAPVSYTINNQTFLYSATFVDDNITTTAQFTFTDAVLLAGEEIDVQGNNLFAEIELGSSAWNIAYAQRMFYGLEQNKVLNFTNLSFDGGYIPNANGPTVPLGWSVDIASNSIPVVSSAIASFRILRNTVTVFATTTFPFTVGQQVVISGLSTGTYLNGVVLTIIAIGLGAASFVAPFVHADIGLTVDTGTVIVAGESQGAATLTMSPVFGDALYLNNQTGATQGQFGMLTQNAYRDAYQVPIILPNTLYSVRVTCSAPSGGTVGTLIVDLTGSLSTVSGTGQYSTGFGTTFGSFGIPFASMSTSMQIFMGTLLTSPFLTGVPVGLLLRVWAQNIGYGDDCLVDRIEIFPTATPTLTTNIRVSYVDNFEAFDANTGNLGLAAHNTQPAFGAFEMHDQLYFLKSGSMESTQDVSGVEPSAPGGGWGVHEVSNRVGACGIHAFDYGEEWVLTACRNGIYGFNGGQPIRIDFQQRELWEMINWQFGDTIWLRNDLPNSRIIVGVPLPTPNRWLPLAPVNANPTSPNVMFMWNYQNLDTFEEIVSGRGVHTTMFGTLAAVDMRLKMSIWQISSPYAGFITQPDLTTQALTICNGQGNLKIYQLSLNQLSDDGAPINSFYCTFGFVDAAKAKENPLLGFHRKLFSFSQTLIAGAGSASLQAFPNYILDKDTLAFNPYTYTVPGGFTLKTNPPDDLIRPLNVDGNRVYLAYSTNAVGSAFRLTKVILVGVMHPFSATNPNSG